MPEDTNALVECDGCGQEVEVTAFIVPSGTEVLYVCPLCHHEHRVPTGQFFGEED